MTFDIARLIPRYIYADKNGYALAKAIERAFQYVVDKVEDGIAALQDPDTMPEWALDHLAEEYNILYDYAAPVESKRDWIRNAVNYYSIYGTPAAIVAYLGAKFSSVDVQEWWEYGADPYHFQVVVTGEWSEAADDWARKAVAAVQNTRSVLDNIIFNSGGVEIPLYVAAAVTGIDITHDVYMLD